MTLYMRCTFFTKGFFAFCFNVEKKQKKTKQKKEIYNPSPPCCLPLRYDFFHRYPR